MARIAAKDRPAFREERRTAILEAAVRVWAKRGFDGTSVAEVAREAGLTKGTLYLYFPSKRALLEETLRRYSLRPFVEDGLERLRGQPLPDVVRGLVAALWRGFEERRELAGVLMRELPNHPEEARHFLEQVMLPMNQLLARYLEDVLPAERRARLDPLVAARSLIGMVATFFLTQRILGGEELLPIPEPRILATITELFLHGAQGAGAAGSELSSAE
jgi:AcrR family transcriptional regulator